MGIDNQTHNNQKILTKTCHTHKNTNPSPWKIAIVIQTHGGQKNLNQPWPWHRLDKKMMRASEEIKQ